jgi:glutamine synthetase
VGFAMEGTLHFSEKEEIVRFISEKRIRILNLCHIPEDGRLKTLSFSATDRNRVREVLEFGERVDGSNLFSFIEAGKSDIYIMPKIDRAFINPFSIIPTLSVLCDYLDEHGKPLDVAPRNVLTRAEEKLRSSNGIVLKALAELEFYIISMQESEMLFPGVSDKNYHETAPFTKFEDLRNEVLVTLANVGIATKYGHSEVGQIFGKGGIFMEQQEVEFLPQNLAEMAETIAIAKWIIRSVCVKYGVSVSFSPKVSLEHVGTGMHIHLCALKNGENIVANPNGTLSTEALKMIGGVLKFAPSLSAFGNTTPASYLRFISRKESPMHICWSARNRLALIRIP